MYKKYENHFFDCEQSIQAGVIISKCVLNDIDPANIINVAECCLKDQSPRFISGSI